MGVGTRSLAMLLVAVWLLGGCAGDSGDGDRAPARGPDATKCQDTIGAQTVEGDLVVPEGKDCRLLGTWVEGRTIVRSGASLLAKSTILEGGVSAHGFQRIEIVEGKVPRRARDWQLGHRASERPADYVFDYGRHLTILDGNINGHYYVMYSRGRVELRGFYLDLGAVYCAGNARKPIVRGISAETPGKLQGQCSGLRNFGESDF